MDLVSLPLQWFKDVKYERVWTLHTALQHKPQAAIPRPSLKFMSFNQTFLRKKNPINMKWILKSSAGREKRQEVKPSAEGSRWNGMIVSWQKVSGAPGGEKVEKRMKKGWEKVEKRLSLVIWRLGTKVCKCEQIGSVCMCAWTRAQTLALVNGNVRRHQRSSLLGRSCVSACPENNTGNTSTQIRPDSVIAHEEWDHPCVWIWMQKEDKERNNRRRWSKPATSALVTRNGRKTIMSNPQYDPCAAELCCDHIWSTPSSADDLRWRRHIFLWRRSFFCLFCFRKRWPVDN